MDLTNQLLYFPKENYLFHITHQEFDICTAEFYSKEELGGSKHYLKDLLFLISIKSCYIIKPGAILIDQYSAEFPITRAVPMFNGSSPGSYWGLDYETFMKKDWRIKIGKEIPAITSNKGLERCFKCNCKTEERRDFSDMSLREMCPRCKI